MANISKNMFVKGARGNVGKQLVFRKHGNKTTLGKMPEFDENLEPTEDQVERRDNFGSAAAYGKVAMEDEDLKKEYAKKAKPGKTAFNMAVRDYMRPPVVKSITATAYTGAPASTIMVVAKDDFLVVAVTVTILNAAGEVLETGAAVLNPQRLKEWTYTATVQNAVLAGTIIRAEAQDVPGNIALLEMSL